jgi:hypothetical protein
MRARILNAVIVATIAGGCVSSPYAGSRTEHGNIFIEARDARSQDPIPHTDFILTSAFDSVSRRDPSESRAQFMGLLMGSWRLRVFGSGYSPLDTIVEIHPRCRTNVRVALAATSCSAAPGCVSQPSRAIIETCASADSSNVQR